MAKLSFDATKVAPQKPMDPVPKDWYQVVITSSDLVPTKTDPKNGVRLELEVEIIDGEYKGRKAWDGINTKNKNPKAQQIGEEQLSAICHATKVFKLVDTAELHNKPFEIKLGYEEERRVPVDANKPDGQVTVYDARNVFKGFRPIDGAANGGPTTPVTRQDAAPKWLKGAGAAPAAEGKAPPPKPGGKAAPAPAPEPEPEPAASVPGGEHADRGFFVYIENDSVEKTGAEVAVMLAQGMPADTPVLAQDEPDGTDWKTAADYGIEAFSPEAEAAPEPAKAPPPKPKGPAAPVAGKMTAPWKTAKK